MSNFVSFLLQIEKVKNVSKIPSSISFVHLTQTIIKRIEWENSEKSRLWVDRTISLRMKTELDIDYRKKKFLIRDYYKKRYQICAAFLVTFTEELADGKLPILYRDFMEPLLFARVS